MPRLPSKVTASSERRAPQQDRAKVTIHAIFQATAQIVDGDGAVALTTNRIAAKAGVSVGTLYQYFPSKEAVLKAMADRERRRQLDVLAQLMDDAEATALAPADLFSSYIHALVRGFGGESTQGPKAAITRLVWHNTPHEDTVPGLREVSERIALSLSRAATANPQLRLRTHPAALFVVTRAVLGTIRAAILERSALVGSPEFEAELRRLAWAMLVDD